jgi:hypothetical protein
LKSGGNCLILKEIENLKTLQGFQTLGGLPGYGKIGLFLTKFREDLMQAKITRQKTLPLQPVGIKAHEVFRRIKPTTKRSCRTH